MGDDQIRPWHFREGLIASKSLECLSLGLDRSTLSDQNIVDIISSVAAHPTVANFSLFVRGQFKPSTSQSNRKTAHLYTGISLPQVAWSWERRWNKEALDYPAPWPRNSPNFPIFPHNWVISVGSIFAWLLSLSIGACQNDLKQKGKVYLNLWKEQRKMASAAVLPATSNTMVRLKLRGQVTGSFELLKWGKVLLFSEPHLVCIYFVY